MAGAITSKYSYHTCIILKIILLYKQDSTFMPPKYGATNAIKQARQEVLFSRSSVRGEHSFNKSPKKNQLI